MLPILRPIVSNMAYNFPNHYDSSSVVSLIMKVFARSINSHSTLVRLIAVVMLMAAGYAQGAAQLYRYTNEKGVQVINSTIPPEFVSKGYDVILEDGTLLRRVPRQLTEDELKLRNTDASRQRLREEEAEQMRAWDESLMLRYSSLDDIEAAKTRAVRDLQIRISIQKSNLITIKAQIEREQERAADIERQGGQVPEALSKTIDSLRREVEDTEQSIVLRREEIEGVKASYQRDMDRFATLLHRVEMRQKSRTVPSNRRNYY